LKIALIRGPSLNPWEMQNFAPLAQKHEILAIGSTKPCYSLSGINLEVKKLACLGQLFQYIPKSIEILKRTLGDPSYLVGLEKAIKGFDIVHTAECANYYSLQAIRARKRGLIGKVIVTSWENIPFTRESYPAQKKLKEEVQHGADCFLAVTEGARKALIKEGVSEEKIKVVPMGVDLTRFKNYDLRFKNKKKLKILFVGRLEEEKGIWELLEAFKSIRNQNLRLTIVGDGSQAGKIKEWLGSNRLSDSISLLGNLSYQEMPQVYHQADIFILPSKPKLDWQEQFGMVLVEAMASGVPIIASKTGAIPEVLGNAGLLVDAGDESQLVRGLERLIKDGRLGKTLASKGIKRVEERFDSRLVASRLEAIYKQLLQ